MFVHDSNICKTILTNFCYVPRYRKENKLWQ